MHRTAGAADGRGMSDPYILSTTRGETMFSDDAGDTNGEASTNGHDFSGADPDYLLGNVPYADGIVEMEAYFYSWLTNRCDGAIDVARLLGRSLMEQAREATFDHQIGRGAQFLIVWDEEVLAVSSMYFPREILRQMCEAYDLEDYWGVCRDHIEEYDPRTQFVACANTDAALKCFTAGKA